MKSKDLSLSAYAADLGVSKTQLWDWLHDKHSMRIETLVWFAQHFDCDLTDLVDTTRIAS